MTTAHKDLPALPEPEVYSREDEGIAIFLNGPTAFTADQMRDYARAALSAQNQPEVSGKTDSHPPVSGEAEPVMWVESEPNARLLPLKDIMDGMCYTVIYHQKKPATNNPVWPLHDRAAPPQQADDGRSANPATFEVLVDIFDNSEAYYKVDITADDSNNVIIRYADMDETWCDELRAALAQVDGSGLPG